ncbi:MAG: immunoglobulin domain-containing protein [Bacteroidaceae bacterium]|nr:immunoglobulin domain-containing protein [Bacteroidaceae bacterium]
MKKLIGTLFVAAAMLALCAGCARERYGYPPVYGEITLSPAEPKVGEEVTFTVQVAKEGDGLLKAEYTWRIDGRKYQENVLDPGNYPVQYKYVFTTAGQHNISLSAMFRMSMMLESGQLFSTASTQTKTFTVKER